jgi:hypothetical protein
MKLRNGCTLPSQAASREAAGAAEANGVCEIPATGREIAARCVRKLTSCAVELRTMMRC